MTPARVLPRVPRRLLCAAAAALALAILIRNFAGLAMLPHGFYTDEASIGYNAWAIAHTGRDEHGYVFPLYFEAFGEWKNPVYIYSLAALLKFVPLTITTSRIPAAIFGSMLVGSIASICWRKFRSPSYLLLILWIGGTMPWLTLLSRIAFEVISMLGVLGIMFWFVFRHEELTGKTALGASIALAISTFAYSIDRLETLLFYGALVSAAFWTERTHPLSLLKSKVFWALSIPSGLAYVVLAFWTLEFPGALLSRFNGVSVFAYGAGPVLGLERFVVNYVVYLSPAYLFVNGDPDLRQSTQYAGMLLVSTSPLLVAGIVYAARTFRTSFLSRFLLFGLAVAPVSAALTEESTPHSLRSADMVPFLLALMMYGAVFIVEWCKGHRRNLIGVGVVLLLLEGTFWNADLFTGYEQRSGIEYDTGEVSAVTTTLDHARGLPIYVSATVPDVYIYFDFVDPPTPPRAPLASSESYTFSHFSLMDIAPNEIGAFTLPKCVYLTTAGTPVPAGAKLLARYVAASPTDGIVDARVTAFTTFEVYLVPGTR